MDLQISDFWLQMSIFAKNYTIMFSQGQWIFAGLFLIAFVIAISFSYRKDILVHRAVYKGSYKILIGFFIFIAMVFRRKIFLKH
mgnify:CR=1 FL=1